MRRAVLLFALLVLPLPLASAAETRSCELVPHGALLGGNTGCTVSAHATTSITAVVSVTEGTVDAIEIEMRDPSGARHVFLCTYEVIASTCLFPVQVRNVPDGVWSVTARIVAADPLGPVLYGGVDTYARLDATFE